MRHLAVVALFVFGCGPSAAPPPTPTKSVSQPKPAPAADKPAVLVGPAARLAAPPTSNARPPMMIAQITAPDVDGLIRMLRAYFQQTGSPVIAGFEPELRTLVREAAQSQQLEVDWSRPIALFVLGDSGAPPRVVLASYGEAKPENVGNELVLHRQGKVWLIGTVADIDRVRGYAATLQVKPGPVSLMVFSDSVLGYADEVKALVSLIGSGASNDPRPARLIEGAVKLLGDSNRFVASLSVEPASAELSLAVAPKPDTGLAAFGAAQKPATHQLFDQMPDGNWTAAASGAVVLDEDQAAMFTETSLVVSDNPKVDEIAGQLWTRVAGHTNRFAWAAELANDGSNVAELIELRDAVAAAMVDTFAADSQRGWDSVPELKRTIDRPTRVAGVMVRAMTLRARARNFKPWSFRYGVTDGFVFAAAGKHAGRWAQQLIGGARRAAASDPAPARALPSGLANALAGSRNRLETMVFWVDAAGLAAYGGMSTTPARAAASRGSGMVVGVALRPDSLGLRITVPADQLGVITP